MVVPGCCWWLRHWLFFGTPIHGVLSWTMQWTLTSNLLYQQRLHCIFKCQYFVSKLMSCWWRYISNLPKLIKLSLIAKFVVSRCAFCKLWRNFGFFCYINHLSGPLRRHMFTCDWCISIQFVFVSVIALFQAIID